ncbi:MAG: 4'-phosphopantetheinyl transferase family protein [Actinophytocola sp.]|uniref:4'-phosphopantetheinyl transferase family protein n=1 Tax=Actinophytocola sp. TaxID=1872138 RepID=UPI003D6B179F
MRCDVWWARPAPATERLLAMLDGVERERYGNYRQEIDRLRFLTGRALIRTVAGRQLGVEPERVVLDSSCYDCGKPHGKPRVVVGSSPAAAPEVSISHSGSLVALAVVDDAPVGVDVEQIRTAEVDDLARIAFSPTERAAFGALPDSDRQGAFFTYWARKEAVVKATGKGMSVAMSAFTLSAHDVPPRVLASGVSEVDPASVRLADLAPSHDYRASVAVLGADAITVTEQDADPLLEALG